MAQVPNNSIIDNFSSKALLCMYGIPGNACSLDSTLFFLSLAVSNYLLGFYQQILKFSLTEPKLKNNSKNLMKCKKKYLFKNLKIFLRK